MLSGMEGALRWRCVRSTNKGARVVGISVGEQSGTV